MSVPGVPSENGVLTQESVGSALINFDGVSQKVNTPRNKKEVGRGATGNGFDLGKFSQQEHFAAFIIIQPIKSPL